MYKQPMVILSGTLLLVLACGDESRNFQDEGGNNHLSFNDRDFTVDTVYCSERMGRVTVRFEQGALFVSRRDEPPGYEAVLRFTSPERSEYVNRAIGEQPGEQLTTEGLYLDLHRGVHGEILLMRSMILLNPDRFTDTASQTMRVRAACPK